MADKTQANIREKGHEPDKAGSDTHCPHCAEHAARIGAIEVRLGMKPEAGVAKEETAAHKEKTPSYERPRH